MKFSFTKMQGCANDYIYLDCRASGVPRPTTGTKRLPSRIWVTGVPEKITASVLAIS